MAKRWYYKDENGNKVPVPQYKINADDYYTKSMSDSRYYEKKATDTLLADKVSKSDIVQSTGTSETAVMSQKAVTDELNKLGLKIGFVKTEKDYNASDYSNLLWGGTTDGWLDTTNKEGRNSFIIPLYPNQTFTVLRRNGTIIHQKVFDYRPQQGLKKDSIADVQGDTYTNNSSNLVYITYGWITNEVHTLGYKVSGVGISEELNTTIERTDSIEKDLNDLNKIVKGVNPIKGVSFTESDYDNIVKNNLKSAWLEIIDSTFDLNKTCWLSLISNKESMCIVQCFTSKGTFDKDLCFSYVSYSQEKTEKEIVLNGYNTYKDKVKLHLVFDFANFGIHHFQTLEIAMNLSDMHTSKIDDNGLVFEVEKLKDDVLNFTKPLVGKTIVCFGDSITEFKDEKGKRYSDYLAEFTGAEIINVGIGGTMLKQRKKTIVSPTETLQDAYACLDIVNLISAVNSNDFTNQELASNYLKTNAGDDNTAIVSRLKAIDWSKVDAVTFFAGTNDWWTGSDSFNDSSSITITNSAGAVNIIITTLLNKYPTLKIFWFTPIVRWNPGNSGERTDENWSDNLKNYTKTEDWQPEPKTLGEWADSIESGVRKRHIPCCNLYWSLGWNQYNFNSFFSTTDGTHPTKGLGMKKIADTMASFILSMGL